MKNSIRFALISMLLMTPAAAIPLVHAKHWLVEGFFKGMLLALTCLLFYCYGLTKGDQK